MTNYRIALLPGDGIGPECMDATRLVLDQLVDSIPELNLSFTSHRAGAELYRESGVALPEEVLEDCLDADAVLLSAIGLPDVRQADGTEVQPTMMVGLRRALKLHSAVRPVKLYPGAPCPLRDIGPGIDFVVIRENLEGLFASFGGGSLVGDEVATDTMVITRKGTTQVADYAFRLAARRHGRPSDGKKMVTCVDKANVFRSLAFFRKVFFDVAKFYPDIESNAVYVDAMSLYMVQNPWDFDVLVMENQFGDILSDLGAASLADWGSDLLRKLASSTGCFSHRTEPHQTLRANMLRILGPRSCRRPCCSIGWAIDTRMRSVSMLRSRWKKRSPKCSKRDWCERPILVASVDHRAAGRRLRIGQRGRIVSVRLNSETASSTPHSQPPPISI